MHSETNLDRIFEAHLHLNCGGSIKSANASPVLAFINNDAGGLELQNKPAAD